MNDSPGAPDLRRDPAERLARAVLPAAGIVWTAAEIMHLAGVHAAADTGIGTAAAATLAGIAVSRGRAPASLPAWMSAAGGWFAVAEAAGPLHWWPCPVLSITWAAAAITAARTAHRHDAVRTARENRQARAGWLMTRHAWGLGGSHLIGFERTRLGELYTVNVKGTGKRRSQILASGIHEVIAEAEDLLEERVHLFRHGPAGRIRISVRRIDPWADVLLHPLACDDPEVEIPAARSIRDEALVGQDPETGTPLTVPMYDKLGGKNIAITSIKGGGKGVLMDNLAEHVTAVPDALMVRINISDKGYAEVESWGPACHLTAFGPQQKGRAAAILKIVAGVIAWRAQAYKRGQYRPSPGDPAIVIFIDESDSAAEVAAIKAGINVIATKAREYGVSYVHAGQRGTADYTSAKARSQDDVYCTGAVSRPRESLHAAGSAGRGMPDMASYGEGKSGVWNIARLGGAQANGRTWVASDDEAEHGAWVERIAQERAFDQPSLPDACREYLGEDYERLLATEVFTTWAHGQEDAAPEEDDGGYLPVDDSDDEAPVPEALPPARAVPREPDAAPAAAAGRTAVAEQDPGDFDRWLKMDVDDDTRARIGAIEQKLASARQALEETAALPRPAARLSPEALAAQNAERWRLAGETAQIPEEAASALTEMLRAGTTISAVMDRFGIARWEARSWLQKLRDAGFAYVDGEKRGRRWRLSPPPEDADSQLTPLLSSPRARTRMRPRA